jgi:hypothetical protein
MPAVHDVPRFDQTTDLDLTFQNDKEKDWFASTSDDPDFIDWHKSGFGPAFAAAYSQGQADDPEWPKTFMLHQWRCWTIARNPPRPVPRPVLEPD